MRRARMVLVVPVALVVSAVMAAQQPQIFRAIEAIVTVDAAVFDGTRPVLGLTAGDFEVTDNGVKQKVDIVDIESLPIDLTLVVDTSGSVEGMIDEIRGYVRESEALLRIDDRIRLITFAGQVRDALGLQPAASGLPTDKIIADGATSIYDATMAALMRTRRDERRQLIVVITDGFETNSAMTADALIEVAKRSDSVLQFFIINQVIMKDSTRDVRDTRGYWLSSVEFDTIKMGYAARLTGGLLTKVAARPELPAHFRMALEEFRTSYVLRYRPVGVKPGGWHELGVRIAGHDYDVRARTGYFWRPLPPK